MHILQKPNLNELCTLVQLTVKQHNLPRPVKSRASQYNTIQ